MKCRHLCTAIILSLVAAGPASSQSGAWSQEDEAGVRDAMLNYMEGALNADADRVARGVHPELNKVMVAVPQGAQGQVLSYNTATTLVESVRGMGDRVAGLPKDVEVTVFDIHGDMAVARAVGAPWYDYAELARIDGEWRIVNVLWAPNQPGSAGEGRNSREDQVAVEAAARAYMEGTISGDAEGMEGVLHPELHKIRLVTLSSTGGQFLQKMSRSALLEVVRAGMAVVDGGNRDVQVETYDVSHDLALAKVTSVRFTDYLQLAKVNGAWTIINVLWTTNPEGEG